MPGAGWSWWKPPAACSFAPPPELAPRLRKVIDVPRKLPRVAMETLAIIAYHQPCTRPEIEEIRGTSLSQQTLDALLEANLVAPKGRREVPGRPTLWGTTPQFLAQFGLKDIRDLPQRGDLLLETPQPTGVSNAPPLVPDMPEPPPEAGPAPARTAQPSRMRGHREPRKVGPSPETPPMGAAPWNPAKGGALAFASAPRFPAALRFRRGTDGLHAARQRAALPRS